MASSKLLALLGLLAVAGYQNRDRLGSILGNITRQPKNNSDPNAPAGSASDGLLGSLGSMFGGSAGGQGISGTLTDLIDRFTGRGHGAVAQSWVETGPNQTPTATEVEDAIGNDSIDALVRQTGLSREDLIERLRSVLPVAVDKLTPDGRIPEDADVSRRFASGS